MYTIVEFLCIFDRTHTAAVAVAAAAVCDGDDEKIFFKTF